MENFQFKKKKHPMAPRDTGWEAVPCHLSRELGAGGLLTEGLRGGPLVSDRPCAPVGPKRPPAKLRAAPSLLAEMAPDGSRH